MADTTEVKFGDLQMDERYKRLERTLKLASLRRGMGKEARSIETWPVATSCSISSINADAFDSSCTTPFLQTSRIGSEVVASSNNLRNILLKKGDGCFDRKAIATSSVKQYHAKANDLADRLIMPPPSFVNNHHRNKQLPKDSHESKKMKPEIEHHSITLNKNVAPKDGCAYAFPSSDVNGECSDVEAPLQIPSNDAQTRTVRVFSNWRVMLNNQNQLIIKGTLECGRVARSKPVIRRLTATNVESIFKHLYHLKGNIVDDRNELPDYVRGKFYNGFPDDWENVYQIWRTFVQQGCPLTFRWPTPITDSDDDLISELTETTFSCMKNNETKSSHMEPYKKQYIRSPTKYSGTVLAQQTSDRHKHGNSRNISLNDSFTQTYISGNLPSNGGVDARIDQETANKENSVQQENLQVRTHEKSSNLKDMLKEDKVDIIINNLLDKNCSQEYINKIIQMFDCLNYVVSYRSGTENVGSNANDSGSNKFVSETSYEKMIDTPPSVEIPLQTNVRYNHENETGHTASNAIKCQSHSHVIEPERQSERTYNEHVLKKRNFHEIETDHTSSGNSESETYAGVPKISLERLLQQKDPLTRRCKRKVRKKTSHHESQKSTNVECHRNSSGPTLPEYANTPTSKGNNHMQHDDTSVSITEDERDLRTKKFVKPVPKDRKECESWKKIASTPVGVALQNNSIEPSPDLFETKLQSKEYNGDTPKTTYNVKSDVSQFDRLMNEVQSYKTRIVQEDAKVRNGIIKMNENQNTAKTNIQNVLTSETTFHRKQVCNENENTPYQRRHAFHELTESQNKHPDSTTKPTVISSLRTNLHMNVFQRETKPQHSIETDVSVIQDETNFNENSKDKSNEKSLDNSSPSKKSSRKKVKRDSPLESKIQHENMNSNTLKESAQDLVKNGKDKFSIESNPKLLTSWVPRVVYLPESDSELGLVFEGKLLNGAGHVAHKNFRTDIVHRRVSPTLIETVKQEFYQLVGDLNDTKHIVPKQLLSQCRYGCPSRIEHFCKTWKSLSTVKSAKVLHETSINTLNVAVSSKGRRIVPPLSYWTGERIALKDDSPVYDPGSSSLENSQNVSLAKGEKCPQPKSAKKQTSHAVRRNDTEESEVISHRAKIFSPQDHQETSEEKKTKFKKEKKRDASKQKRSAQQFTLSDSSDSNESPTRKMCTPSKYSHATNSGFLKAANRSTKMGQKSGNSERNDSQKADSSKAKVEENCDTPVQRHTRDIRWTYCQDIPLQDDVLSDDQISHI